MEPRPLATEVVILLLRFAVLLVLYLFLWQLVAVVWRDLRRPSSWETEPSKPIGRLFVVSSGGTTYQPGHSFPIYRITKLGRGSDNSVVLDDGFVSTNHAELRYQEGTWWVADLGSRNGTWINDRRVRGQTAAKYGDVLAVGQVKLKLSR